MIHNIKNLKENNLDVVQMIFLPLEGPRQNRQLNNYSNI